MSTGNQPQRPRGPHEGVSTDSVQLAASDSLNGRSAGGAGGLPGTLSRAEKFEDEKRRIVESCFGRTDSDGSVSESYITHIRIVEDAAFPSSPPPPQSPAENKKPRIVIVAVRKSGRVRMHKARENVNGTFSIGKTWVLDDLTGIQSFVGTAPSTYDEQQRKEWAGPVGFLVTIQKPYYWQANTPKEKDFFIGSLIKIYRKYTGGKVPQLQGFSPQQLEVLTGGSGQRTRSPSTPAIRPGLSPANSTAASSENQLNLQPGAQRDPTGDVGREPRSHPSNEPYTRKSESQEREIAVPGQFPSSDFVRNIRPQDSRSRFQPGRSESPSTSISRNDSPAPSSPRDDRSLHSFGPAHSAESFSSRREHQGARIPPNTHPSVERLRANGLYPQNSRGDSPNRQGPRSPNGSLPSLNRIGIPSTSPPIQNQVPERRRPPIVIPSNSQDGNINADSPQEFMTPTGTPTVNNDEAPKSPYTNGRVKGNHVERTAGKDQPPVEYFPNVSAQESNASNQEDNSGSTKVISETFDRTKEPTIAPIIPPTPTSPALLSETIQEEEIHRPGLGPMIKKRSPREIANVFRKAAVAHNAFKPRTGGAADKIRSEALKTPNTPDGVNGVFPAPSLLRETSQDNVKALTPTETTTVRSFTPEKLKPEQINNLPELKLTATSSIPTTATADEKPTSESAQSFNPASEKSVSAQRVIQEDQRRKRPSNYSAKYAKALGIDPNLLEGRTLDFESVLTDFGWGEEETKKSSYDDFQHNIRRDLAGVETGSWLGGFEHNDERVTIVGKMLDKAIAECEELDGLLTLYNVELGTLREDVAYIEAQSQGLQVQTANQRLLHTELQTLLETISISSSQLQILKDASLTKSQGVQSIETALVQLYKAMLTIDPKLNQASSNPGSTDRLNSDRNSVVDKIGSEISTMRAVQEKKIGYRRESIGFVQRLKQYMSGKFREAGADTSNAVQRGRNSTSLKNSSKLDSHSHDSARAELWKYSPLMLFAREIDAFEWEELIRLYENSVKSPYQEEFRANIAAWKRVTKNSTGEEQDLLFTTQEKESEGIVGRKLTVKRAKTVRTDGFSRNSSGEKPRDGSMNGYEAFAGALYDMTQAIFVEQNFIVDFFHLSSLENIDFPDAVTAVPPESRIDVNLSQKKLFDPDRQMARQVQNTMEDIYAFWPSEMDDLVDWFLKQDPLQGIGLLFSIETKLVELEETNQDYLTQVLSKCLTKLTSRLDRFVDEQVRAIEDTKVKIKKRKGVIAFVKTFPYFSASIENMLPTPRANRYEVRHMVNDVYAKINKAIFESLKYIAKEGQGVLIGQKGQNSAATDTDDKEVLNYHILLIENMNHYIEEVEVRDNPILQEWKDRAMKEMREHLNLYLNAVIRRPLGKLLDFLESTESLLAHSTDSKAIATRASHSRSTFKKVLSTLDAKEIRRGIEALKKRVEKHFGDADDPGLSRNLVIKVLRECENQYVSVHDRTGRIVADVYEGGLDIEWTKVDISTVFRR